jgi:hypothetical protein
VENFKFIKFFFVCNSCKVYWPFMIEQVARSYFSSCHDQTSGELRRARSMAVFSPGEDIAITGQLQLFARNSLHLPQAIVTAFLLKERPAGGSNTADARNRNALPGNGTNNNRFNSPKGVVYEEF